MSPMEEAIEKLVDAMRAITSAEADKSDQAAKTRMRRLLLTHQELTAIVEKNS